MLHPGSSRTEAQPAADGPSPTRTDKPKGLFGLIQKIPSPPKLQLGAQQGAAVAPKCSNEQQQLADGPGNVYANLPCIKQLQPSRSAALDLYVFVLGALPGVKLDSSWVVYQSHAKSPADTKPSTTAVDSYICILPTLQPPVSTSVTLTLAVHVLYCLRQPANHLLACWNRHSSGWAHVTNNFTNHYHSPRKDAAEAVATGFGCCCVQHPGSHG